MLVSLITVSYNSEKTLSDTITSVLEQTYTDIEYIIIDGNSSDKTVSIIKGYEEDFKVKNIPYRWVSEPDNGIYDAMNKGIAMAKGELIGIINSDDWYADHAVATVVEEYTNDPLTIISGTLQKVNFDKSFYRIRYNKTNVSKLISREMPINFPSTFIHRSVYQKIGVFDVQYTLSADYDFIFRAVKAGVRFIFSDNILTYMRNSGATGDIKNLKVTAREDHHIRKKNQVSFANLYYGKRLVFNFLVTVRDLTFGRRTL